MNVAFCGYRTWAAQIFTNIANTYSRWWKITDISEADVILYYGWSWRIHKDIYENKLCLILHPSPLPKYRGGSPLQHQIIAGEKFSAVTICRATDRLDSGDIYSQTFFSLEGTLDEIFKDIVEIGTRETLILLDEIAMRIAHPYPQDELRATTCKRRKPEESELTVKDFKTKTAKELYNFIRALTDPYPNAFIRCKDGKKLYFTGVKIE